MGRGRSSPSCSRKMEKQANERYTAQQTHILQEMAMESDTYEDFGMNLKDFLHEVAAARKRGESLGPMLTAEPPRLQGRFSKGRFVMPFWPRRRTCWPGKAACQHRFGRSRRTCDWKYPGFLQICPAFEECCFAIRPQLSRKRTFSSLNLFWTQLSAGEARVILAAVICCFRELRL